MQFHKATLDWITHNGTTYYKDGYQLYKEQQIQ